MVDTATGQTEERGLARSRNFPAVAASSEMSCRFKRFPDLPLRSVNSENNQVECCYLSLLGAISSVSKKFSQDSEFLNRS